jgi:hypothetical protein
MQALRPEHAYLGGAGVKTSRLCAGSGFGFGLGAFLTSFLPLSLLPIVASVPHSRASPQGHDSINFALSRGRSSAIF